MKKKANKKPKALTRKGHQKPDVPVNEAIKNLKGEIIDEVKKLSSGQVRSIYGLCEKGKELMQLESGEWEGDDSIETQSKTTVPKGGLTADQF